MGITHVDVKEAYRLQAGEGYAYIDVRSIPEYEGGHPAGAHNVPLLHYDAQTGHKTPNQEFLAVMEANYPHDARSHRLSGRRPVHPSSVGAGLARV